MEKRLLQASIVLAACVPITAGTYGMLAGTDMIAPAADISLDNHFRYLSGLLAGLGFAFLFMVRTIERHTFTIRLLTGLVVLGGLARLMGALFVATPSPLMLAAIGMELVVTPLLCLWQGRLARQYQ